MATNSSILSFPERGPWGKSSWRGNCSGHVYKEIFEHLKPKSFVDPMVGSGTSVEVANEMGIESYGFDLHQGFNAITDSIVNKVGKEVDLVISHPPYGSMILYSSEVWGNTPHPGDLSHCIDDEDFHQKMQLVLMNQREATKPGHFYGTIIGDLRSNGKYVSYQAECIARMPSDELAAVLIKDQHNTKSSFKSYMKMKLPFITHEYILLWKKKEVPMIMLLNTMAKEQYARLTGTWRTVVKAALVNFNGQASLQDLYSFIQKNAPDNVAKNENWKAKIRQILNTSSKEFANVECGVWKMVA